MASGRCVSVRLRDVCPSGGAGAVAAPVYPIVQVCQLLVEVFSVGLPRHAIDTRRRVPLKREVAPLQEIDGDVMQQCGEPHTLALSRRLAHGDKPARRGFPAQCPDRGRLAAVPLGRGPSLHDLRRGRSPLCSAASSVLLPRPTPHPRACSSFGCCLHEPVRRACPDTDEVSQVPYKGRLHVHGVSDCARLLVRKPLAGRMLPSRHQNGIGTSEFDPFRSSIPSPWSPL